MTSGVPFEMSVTFMGSGIASQFANPNMMCVTQEEYMHDVARLEFWGGDITSDSLLSGTPVYITWGRAPLMRAFYGYVNHATRVNNSMTGDKMGRNALHVTVVGASWFMKQTASVAYVNMSITQIVEQIAKTFNLDSLVEPHSMVWPVKQQGGLSFWEFCVQLCKEIGYTFYCNGIQLVAIKRQTNPQDLNSPVTIYDYRRDPSHLPIFNPTLGANSPPGGQLRTRQMAAVDPRTNQIIYTRLDGSPQPTALGAVQESPLFTVTETATVDNPAQLTAKLYGSALQNQFYLTASAVGQGDPMLAQGGLVFVRNANGSQNGLWFVTRAEHHLSAQTYAMNMELGRDALGAVSSISTDVQTAAPPKGVLLNGQTWVLAAA